MYINALYILGSNSKLKHPLVNGFGFEKKSQTAILYNPKESVYCKAGFTD